MFLGNLLNVMGGFPLLPCSLGLCHVKGLGRAETVRQPAVEREIATSGEIKEAWGEVSLYSAELY